MYMCQKSCKQVLVNFVDVFHSGLPYMGVASTYFPLLSSILESRIYFKIHCNVFRYTKWNFLSRVHEPL